MAYQNVKTPRFYIDYLSYNQSIRNVAPDENNLKHIGLNSGGDTYTVTSDAGKVYIDTEFNNPLPLPRTDIVNGTSTKSGLFVGCLGHNAHENGLALDWKIKDSSVGATYDTQTQIINWESPDQPILLDGFTLCKKTDLTDLIDIRKIETRFFTGEDAEAEVNLFAKTVLFGQYYNMPHSPDLSLTLTHDYSGVKTIETIGGASLSNARWSKPSKWGDREAWQLGDFPYYYSGRRIWDLSFSYISDTDIEPYSYYGNKYDSDTGGSPTVSEGDENWFQSVLFYTNGGQLPFIFNPDPSIEYLAPDDGSPPRVPEYAICKFDMNSFSRKQVANNVYNIKVKVREVW